MGRRREERLRVILPVRVWGMDAKGKPFIQSAHTVDITRTGGRLRNLFCVEKKGEIIRVQHGNQKCNFRVTWVGHPGTPEHGEIGIYSLEPDKYIWGVDLAHSSQADSYQVHEQPELISFQGQAAASERKSSAATATAVAGETRKRRLDARFPCAGSVDVTPEGASLPLWCILSDLSISGCYAETTTPFAAHTRLTARVKAAGMEFHAKGTVRTSHPGVGMGIAFTGMNDVDKARLRGYIEELRGKMESGVLKPRQDIAPSAFSSAVPGGGQRGRSGTTAAILPPSADGRRPISVKIDPLVMQRLAQLRSDLWEMQSAFQPNTMDSRLLREVKESVDRARQSIYFVQQWLELQSKKQSSSPVVEKLHNERMRMTRELNRQLTLDLDAGSAECDAQALEDLYLAVRDLHNRLAAKLHKPKT